MKNMYIAASFCFFSLAPLYAAEHALGRPRGHQDYQNPRPILTEAEERALLKEAYAYRLFSNTVQPTPAELAAQATAQNNAALHANAATAPLRHAAAVVEQEQTYAINARLYPQRRAEALREAELAREINLSNRLENLWWALAENSLIKLVAFSTTKATSFVAKWWYADKIAAQKKQAEEAAKVQAHAQLQATMLQRLRDNQQLQLTQTQILAEQQQLLNNFVATTDDDKNLHAALKTKFKAEISQHFGIKPAHEEALNVSTPQAYMVLPPAKTTTSATPSTPAAA